MKLIIDIPYGLKDVYEHGNVTALDVEEMKRALQNGTPLEQIKAEIDRQEKWLLQAGYTAYNVDIAFDSIKSVLAESELLQMAVMNGKLRKEHK